MSIEGLPAAQLASVARLMGSGYKVAASDGWLSRTDDGTRLLGHIVLTRGTTYRPSGWDFFLTLATCGLWVLVIGVKAATRWPRVVSVGPDGSVYQLAGWEASGWAMLIGVLALGALALLVATIFSPLVAAVAVPVAVALLGRVGE